MSDWASLAFGLSLIFGLVGLFAIVEHIYDRRHQRKEDK